MVAIKSFEAERFLRELPSHINVFLIHGHDPGLIQERSVEIAKTFIKNSGEIIRLSADSILTDPNLLFDELFAISIFVEKLAIRIALSSKNFTPILDRVLDASFSNTIIVCDAGSLRPDAAIRKLLEKSNKAVTIECNSDTHKDLEKLIDQAISVAGSSIEPDAKQELVLHVGADRLVTRSEVAKLLLYTAHKNRITRDDVINCIVDESKQFIDDIVISAMSGDLEKLDKLFTDLKSNSIDVNQIVSTGQRYVLNLIQARNRINSGGSLDEARKIVTRNSRLFAAVTNHLNKFDKKLLNLILTWTKDTAVEARYEPYLASYIVQRLFWKIAHLSS